MLKSRNIVNQKEKKKNWNEIEFKFMQILQISGQYSLFLWTFYICEIVYSIIFKF